MPFKLKGSVFLTSFIIINWGGVHFVSYLSLYDAGPTLDIGSTDSPLTQFRSNFDELRNDFIFTQRELKCKMSEIIEEPGNHNHPDFLKPVKM